jgi:hypothetical protein
MARSSILPTILAVLEPYLEAKETAWSALPDDAKRPTLPTTPDRKVNVRQLVHELGLPASAAQHFFNKPALAYPVNMLAQVQGIKPIGSRAVADAADDAARQWLRRQRAETKRLAEQLAQTTRVLAQVTEERDRLKARLDRLQQYGSTIRHPDIEY